MKEYGQMKLVCFLGGGMEGNLIGAMMEAGFKSQGLNYRYLAVPVEREHLGEAVRAMCAFKIKGAWLGAPLREDAAGRLDELSPAAAMTGIVDFVCLEDGKLIGENTLGKGFLTSLIVVDRTVYGKTLTILGDGEMALSVAVESVLSGAVRVHIVGYDEGRGRELSGLIREKTGAEADFILWRGPAAVPEDTDVLVNCTCAGIGEGTEKPDVDYESIRGDMTVCDTAEVSLETEFLAEASRRGARTINGPGMLVNRTALSCGRLTETPWPREVMARALCDALGAEPDGDLPKPDPEDMDRMLIEKMTEYYAGDPKRIQHFLKVYEFARLIGEREKLSEPDMFVLRTAAIVHDIGIKESEKKYGSSAGKYQEKEGPAVAEKLLEDCGYPEEAADRALYLIAHHHTYQHMEGMDYQILVEADFLVNLYEDGEKREACRRAKERIFKTRTGRWYLDRLFLS